MLYNLAIQELVEDIKTISSARTAKKDVDNDSGEDEGLQ